VNEKKLLKYAVDYLSKYESSKKNLSDVLKRKVFRLKLSVVEKNLLIKNIKNIVLKLEKNNFIDDNRYSLSKISSLSRLGKSKNFISNYLLKKGIDNFVIQNNFEIYKENNDDWEINSAVTYAKKKKLLESHESYEKKLAKMARAGFSYNICKKILG